MSDFIQARRNAVVSALCQTVELFTSYNEESFEEIMSNGILPIADAVGLNRVAIFQMMKIDGIRHIGQIYRWDKEASGAIPLDEKLTIVPNMPLVERWFDLMDDNKVVRLRLSDMASDEYDFLHVFGLKSILMVPIFALGELWGMVTFQDHINDEYFDDGCQELLRAAAQNYANAFIHEELFQKSKNNQKMIDALKDTAVTLLSHTDISFEEILQNSMRPIADVANIDRIVIYGYVDEKKKMFKQTFRWDKASDGFTPILADLLIDPRKPPIADWMTKLNKEHILNMNISVMNKAELAFMDIFKLKSILLVPIFSHNSLWGIVTFQDYINDKPFLDEYIDLLKSAAHLYANVIIQHEIEKSMREAEEYGQMMLNANPVCCKLWTSDFKLLDCNEAAVKLCGLNSKQEYFDSFFDMDPEFQPDGQNSKMKRVELLKKAFENDGQSSFEWLHYLPDGTVMPAEITLIRIKHRDEYVVAAYTRDLRDETKMIETILRRDKLLAMTRKVAGILLDLSPIDFDKVLYRCIELIAITIDGDNAGIWLNEIKNDRLSYELIHSWSRNSDAKIPKYQTTELYYDRDLPGWDKVLMTGQHINVLTEDMPPIIKKRMKSYGLKSLFLAPIFLNDDFWGFISFDRYHKAPILDDIEQDILRSCCLLVANALLRNEIIQQLKDATAAKSNFLANISHEMRTPLNSIIGMTLIAKKSQSLERKDYALSIIEGASANLLNNVNDVLDMTKIEANKMELSSVEYDLERMIQKVISILQFRFNEKKQSFNIHMDINVPHFIIGDDYRLTQVITNLLTNASKFSPEGGKINLNISYISDENDVCTLLFEITDNGIGISPEQMEKLFQPFSQAESGTSRKYGGTGLGLAMCKRIVELMGGAIGVESELDKGSRFYFTIKTIRGSKHLSSLLSPGINVEDIKILVVDDDVFTLNIFQNIFDHIAMRCDVASSGEAALNMIDENGEYDVYFIDWQMDGINGIELSKIINERSLTGKTNITIISGYIPPGGNEITDAGVDKFMSKPLFASSIINRVNEYLDVESAQNEKNFIDATRGLFKGKKLLLVEDIDINREIVISLLDDTGVTIDEAVNGKEALEKFNADPNKYDLIFMDLQMPIMDGLEATRKIRSLKTNTASTIPIIAMTANVFREDVERCHAAGMDGHLGKPLNMDEVNKMLRKYLI